MILYIPSGSLNDMGDGYLEEEEDDDEESMSNGVSKKDANRIAHVLCAHVFTRHHESDDSLSQSSSSWFGFLFGGNNRKGEDEAFSLKKALEVFEKAEKEKGKAIVTTRELVSAVVKK